MAQCSANEAVVRPLKRQIDNNNNASLPIHAIVSGRQNMPTLQDTPISSMFSNEPYEEDSLIIEDHTGKRESDVMLMKPWRKMAFKCLALTGWMMFPLGLWGLSLESRYIQELKRLETPPKGLFFSQIRLAVELLLAGKTLF